MEITQEWGDLPYIHTVTPYLEDMLRTPSIDGMFQLVFMASTDRTHIKWELRVMAGQPVAGGSVKGVKYAFEVTAQYSTQMDCGYTSSVYDKFQDAYEAAKKLVTTPSCTYSPATIKQVIILA
jgi:hypothetical protein